MGMGIGTAVALAALFCGAGPAAIDLTPGQRQLFLDDYAVEELTGLERTMHQPEKRGAVVRPDAPSDGTLIQIRSAPMWVPEEEQYKLLYLAYAYDAKYTVGVALATSKDGLHWEKPNLGKMTVHGSTDNNWVALDPSLTWPNNSVEGVLYDPNEADPSRKFKALLGATERKPIVSPDCIHWAPLGDAVIPSSDESQLIYDDLAGRFMAVVKTGNQYGRAFSCSFSEDFVHWTPNRFLFGADAKDQEMAPDVIRRHVNDPNKFGPLFVDPDPATGWKPPEGEVHHPTWRAEVYNVAVFPYEGVYIGMPTVYHPTGMSLPARNNTDGFDEIQLIASRDLEHWERLGERESFIPLSGIENGRVGVYDRMQILAASKPIVHDEELWFYYSGLKWRSYIYELNLDGTPRDPSTLNDEERADFEDGWGAVCLAVLRRDGFVSVDAADEGSVLTKPMRIAGKQMCLNLDADGGEARVEVLDVNGDPLDGYALDDALPVTGNGVRLPVQWRAERGVPSLPRQVVRLRIHLKSAQLYAFWTED
ncbi:MAG: hypothetical protein GY851_14925 [bacterium]|nr:hypothetical protein [bacterium]